ncbi:MAG: MBL fold metallo-hydrolase, partial [Flammeovirgaceae bacterium]
VYKNFIDQNGIKIPNTRSDYEFGMLERELVYGTVRFDVSLDSIQSKIKFLPDNFRKKLTDDVGKKEQFEFVTLTPTLDLVKIVSQNNKVLIAKFADHLALFEVPQGIELNYQLQAELAKKYPNKPIWYIFVTHHHPDHAGGIRAYAHLNIKLITTEGNSAYFEKLLAASHSIGTNRINGANKKIQMDFVQLNGQKTWKDKVNEVTAYEIGAATQHTNEHLAYYFPKSKILWTGDLLIFDLKESVYPAGARGKSVYDLIKDKKLIVEKIYTSWPLHGQKNYGTVDFLDKLVTK